VLATTEPQKVMATIVDRTQRFDFQRPSLEQIAEVVRRVAKAEGIEAEDGAVALISRSASGSFRDALGTLDQLVSFGGDKVATDAVVELLGAADAELLFDTTDAIGAGDAAKALEAVDRLAQSGRDPGQFARDEIAHLRQLLVARATGEVPESFTVTVAQPDRLAEQAGRIGEAKLMGAIDELSAAVANMREGDDPRLSLEVALLKVTRPALDSSQEALLRRIEALEAGGGSGQGPAPPTPSGGAKPKAAPKAKEKEKAKPKPEGPSAQAAASAEAEPDPAVVSTIEIERVVELWPAVVDHVRSSGAEMLGSLFDGSRPIAVDVERSVIKVGFPESAKFNKRKAEARPNVEKVSESLQAILGTPLRPVYELVEVEEAPAEAGGAPEMAEEEIIEMIKTKFDASEVADDGEPEARESEAG
jgi:DNA polymerase-3 subunit gamma/tau